MNPTPSQGNLNSIENYISLYRSDPSTCARRTLLSGRNVQLHCGKSIIALIAQPREVDNIRLATQHVTDLWIPRLKSSDPDTSRCLHNC